MSLTVPYFREARQVNERNLLRLILEQSKARNALPFQPRAKVEDTYIEWVKELQDMNHRISWEFQDTPESRINLQELSAQIPFLHRQIGWTKHEMLRIARSEMSPEDRINTLVGGFGNDEDILLFGGGTTGDPETGITGFSDTTNNVTATSTELNVTTIALSHSSLTAQIQELIDDPTIRYEDKRYPLVLIVTPDVVSKAASVLSTVNEKDTALDKLLETLIKRGGAGSGIIVTPKLGATVTKTGAMDPYTVTAGTTNSCLYPLTPRFGRVITSPMEIRKYGPEVNYNDGLTYKVGYRVLPQFFEQTAFRYGGTAVIA